MINLDSSGDLTDADDVTQDDDVIDLNQSDEPEVIPPSTQIQIVNQDLNQSDAHFYEEEYSPVEEVEPEVTRQTGRRTSSPQQNIKPRPEVQPEVNLDETMDDRNTCVICCEKLTVNHVTHIRQPSFNIEIT